MIKLLDLPTDIHFTLLKTLPRNCISKYLVLSKSLYLKLSQRNDYIQYISYSQKLYTFKNPNNNLYKAVIQNDYEAVKKYVNLGANFRHSVYYHKAIENNNIKIVSYWLKKNKMIVANLDLVYAIESNSIEVFTFLWKKLGYTWNIFPMHIEEIWLNPQPPFEVIDRINQLTNSTFAVVPPKINIIDRLLFKQMENRYLELIKWQHQKVTTYTLQIALKYSSALVVFDIAQRLNYTMEEFIMDVLKSNRIDILISLEQVPVYDNYIKNNLEINIKTTILHNAGSCFMHMLQIAEKTTKKWYENIDTTGWANCGERIIIAAEKYINKDNYYEIALKAASNCNLSLLKYLSKKITIDQKIINCLDKRSKKHVLNLIRDNDF